MREFTFGSAQSGTGGLTTASRAIVTLNMLQPAAGPSANIELFRHWAGQASSTTSAQQRIGLQTQAAALPTTAVSVTPRNLKLQDSASIIAGAASIAAGKCGINIGTEGAGTLTSIWEDDFNILNGYLKVATPAETEIFPAGFASAMAFQLLTQPGNTATWSWGQNFREI